MTSQHKTSPHRWFGPTKKEYKAEVEDTKPEDDKADWIENGFIVFIVFIAFALLQLRTHIVTTNHFTNETVVRAFDGKKIPSGYCVTTQAVEYSMDDKISYAKGNCKDVGKEEASGNWYLGDGQFCVEDKADGRHIFFGDGAKTRKKADFIQVVNSGVSSVMTIVEKELNISKSWQ